MPQCEVFLFLENLHNSPGEKFFPFIKGMPVVTEDYKNSSKYKEENPCAAVSPKQSLPLCSSLHPESGHAA